MPETFAPGRFKFYWVNNNLGGRWFSAGRLIAPLTKRRGVKTAAKRRLFCLDTPSICGIMFFGEQQTTKKVIYPFFLAPWQLKISF